MPKRNCFWTAVLLALTLSLAVGAQAALAGDYAALQGAKSANAVFDVSVKAPGQLLVALKLIHTTYKDPAILKVNPKPRFAVVFLGPAVKLVNTSRTGVSPKEAKLLDQVAQTLTAMAKDGIELEICLFAAKMQGVEPSTILPEITQVGNGWISLIGYQSRGFALVPVP